MAKRTPLWLATGLALILAAPPCPAVASSKPSKKEIAFAVSLARKGLWNEAAHRFRLLVRKDPENPRLWNNLAVAYEASRQFQEARRAYTQAAVLAQKQRILEPLEANREAFEAFFAVWAERQPGLAAPEPKSHDDGR